MQPIVMIAVARREVLDSRLNLLDEQVEDVRVVIEHRAAGHIVA